MNTIPENSSNFITVNELIKDMADDFNLRLIAGRKGLSNKIIAVNPHRPGLAMAGYTKYFRNDTVQILGRTEISYIESISQKKRSKFMKTMFSFTMPCIIISRHIDPPRLLKILCNKHNVPLLTSDGQTTLLIHGLTVYLNNHLAPGTTLHGTLIDVYGVGVLLTGLSGIGKSEAALDLIDRSHRLVADDAVKIFKRGDHLLMGTGIAPDSSLQHHMEVRGVGILDIAKMFGIRGVRVHKRVEIEINLIKWSPEFDVDRTGIKEEVTKILGVEIPFVQVALVSGKNISVIIEVIALNYVLKLSGYDTAKIFNASLINLMKQKAKKLARLDEDEE